MHGENIYSAIKRLELLRIKYNDMEREVAPHAYGIVNGKKAVLTIQVGGESESGNLPGWRLLYLEKITALAIIPQNFKPDPTPFNPEKTVFDSVYIHV